MFANTLFCSRFTKASKCHSNPGSLKFPNSVHPLRHISKLKIAGSCSTLNRSKPPGQSKVHLDMQSGWWGGGQWAWVGRTPGAWGCPRRPRGASWGLLRLPAASWGALWRPRGFRAWAALSMATHETDRPSAPASHNSLLFTMSPTSAMCFCKCVVQPWPNVLGWHTVSATSAR